MGSRLVRARRSALALGNPARIRPAREFRAKRASHEAGDPVPLRAPARQDDGDGGTHSSTIMHKEN
ncbi:hypothetical protein FMUBM48_04880 [Nocardia cyriacigeorgica]|nr:hypothetical protein FMUBM48_04880 [Nocardia cyriacigeorgica]